MASLINPQNVLLIGNANTHPKITELSGIGDWYANARGLTDSNGNYYWLTFDFGTATHVALDKNKNGSNVYPLIDGNNGVKCVACSPKFPSVLVGKTIPQICVYLNSLNTYSFDAVLVLPGVPKSIYYDDYNVTNDYFNNQYTEMVLAYFFARIGIGNSGGSHYSNFTYIERYEFNYSTYLHDSMGPMIADGTAIDAPNRLPNGFYRTAAPKQLTTIKNFKYYYQPIYFGRIGWVSTDGSESNPDYLYAWGGSSFDQVKTIVNNAIAAEKTDNFSQLHILGGIAYSWNGGALPSIALNRLGYSAGLNLSYIAQLNKTFQHSGYGYSEASWWGGYIPKPGDWTGTWPPVPDKTDFWNGAWPTLFKSSPGAPLTQANYPPSGYGGVTIQGAGDGAIANGVPIQAFCFMSPRAFLSVRETTNSITFSPGGFAYAFGSPAPQTQEYCLRNGGSLGFANCGEPSDAGIPMSDSLLYWLLNGFSGAEACYRAGSNWRYTGPNTGWGYFSPNTSQPAIEDSSLSARDREGFWNYCSPHGDPLYTPYKAHNLQLKFMQVGQ